MAMSIQCPNCTRLPDNHPDLGHSVVRIGYYQRSSDHTTIQRYRCRLCLKHFSDATTDPCVRQKKRHLNPIVATQLCAGVSLRETGRILGITYKTVMRKRAFVCEQAGQWLAEFLRTYKQTHAMTVSDAKRFPSDAKPFPSDTNPLSIDNTCTPADHLIAVINPHPADATQTETSTPQSHNIAAPLATTNGGEQEPSRITPPQPWQMARVMQMQFDDLETFEHSKLKPLSITLAVEKHTRFILGARVSVMPAKGLLAKASRKKYGRRPDKRRANRRDLLKSLVPLIDTKAEIESDQNPHYEPDVRKYFPSATYTAHKGRRGCVVGQGELKSGGWDPLFSLNHTCAMLRANINRLIRRTWCTTKKKENLEGHLWLYFKSHNTRIQNKMQKKSLAPIS